MTEYWCPFCTAAAHSFQLFLHLDGQGVPDFVGIVRRIEQEGGSRFGHVVEDLRQAVADYQRTGFGGWPWRGPDPVHRRTDGRFAIHADGRIEHRDMVPSG